MPEMFVNLTHLDLEARVAPQLLTGFYSHYLYLMLSACIEVFC